MSKIINISNLSFGKERRNLPLQRADFSAPVTMLPVGERNYCLFNQNKVSYFVSQREHALPYLKQILQTSNDEKEIVEALYIIDRMADKNVKGLPALYSVLSKFNETESQNIQAFLAGIYRKIQVPDAFGPLVKMLIKNSINPSLPTSLPRGAKAELPLPQAFDPNEEIGGAILEYIRNYSQGPKPIDYTA